MEDSFEALRFALVDVDLDFSRNRFVVLDVRLLRFNDVREFYTMRHALKENSFEVHISFFKQ